MTDISQPLDRLGPDETMKANSDQLRGTIRDSLVDPVTGAVSFIDNKLMKFHGIYQQDDRDIRDERRLQKLEPAYSFMIRVRMPAGVCTRDQWLVIDDLARAHGEGSIRLTTRQTVQFHWVVKEDVQAVIQGLDAALLDSIAACGDDARGVMSTAYPGGGPIEDELDRMAKSLSDAVIPRMPAYREIWLGKERVDTGGPEEPVYGRQYLPRKFKIGIARPPWNDVDIFTQDLGFIAIVEDGALAGFNIVIGGGLGRSDQDRETFARLGDVIGFIPKDRLNEAALAVITVQRDWGNRAVRARARFKYTVHDRGVAAVKAEIEARLGTALEPARPFQFEHNGDADGWRERPDGSWERVIHIPAGRITGGLADRIRALVERHAPQVRITPNQNLIIAGIAPADRAACDALIADGAGDAAPGGAVAAGGAAAAGRAEAGGAAAGGAAAAVAVLARRAVPCVALPTCPLAMAEAERYMPDFLHRLGALTDRHGVGDVPISVRISGCPNGCSRPYVAEIALTGRAPGKYNLYLGGSPRGDRLGRLVLENAGEAAILARIDEALGDFARDRHDGEAFGDHLMRTMAQPA